MTEFKREEVTESCYLKMSCMKIVTSHFARQIFAKKNKSELLSMTLKSVIPSGIHG